LLVGFNSVIGLVDEGIDLLLLGKKVSIFIVDFEHTLDILHVVLNSGINLTKDLLYQEILEGNCPEEAFFRASQSIFGKTQGVCGFNNVSDDLQEIGSDFFKWCFEDDRILMVL